MGMVPGVEGLCGQPGRIDFIVRSRTKPHRGRRHV